jgi:TBC1 domain family member 20
MSHSLTLYHETDRVQIILSRKEEALHLEEEGEDGMIHSLLSSFPNIADDALDEEEDVAENLNPLDEDAINDLNNTVFKEELLQTAAPDGHVDRDFDPILDHVKTESEQHERPANNQGQGLDPEEGVAESSPSLDEDDISNTFSKEELLQTAAPDGHVDRDFGPSEQHERPANNQDQGLDPDKVLQRDHNKDEVRTARSSPRISEISLEHGKAGSATDEHILDKIEDPEMPAGDSIIPNLITDDDEMLPECSTCPKMTKLFLTDLLKHADTLYNTFPPSHSGLSLSSIMGPQSVIFTWSESSSSLPSDNIAEAMVSCPELVVYPIIETHKKSKESSESEENTSKKTRRKRHRHRKSPFSHMEKKTMVAGTVIVLGVAMAIYGVKAARTGGDRSVYGIFHSFTEGHNGHTSAKDWRRLGGWVGGAVVGVTTKIMNGLSSTSP